MGSKLIADHHSQSNEVYSMRYCMQALMQFRTSEIQIQLNVFNNSNTLSVKGCGFLKDISDPCQLG